MTAPISGTVINIQHYCYHDGPGVRTTVFLKGCTLHCAWCGNPESIAPQPQLVLAQRECLGAAVCGICTHAPFPERLFQADAAGEIHLNRSIPLPAQPDVSALCPARAITCYGRSMSAAAVIAEVDRDAPFYRSSGGGITVSGGEPLMQPEFTAELLRLAHAHGYSTAIETAANVPWKNLETVLPHADTVLHDIKLFDRNVHRNYTGADNVQILANLQRAYQTFPEKTFIARTPVIHGVNDSQENIRAILQFILPYENVKEYELLPYHTLGVGKYRSLGIPYPEARFSAPPESHLQHLREIIRTAFQNRRESQ